MTKNKPSEFQGYVKATLEDIKSDIKEIKENYKSQIEKCDKRFNKIEDSEVESKINYAKIAGIGGIAAIFISILMQLILKFWR